MKVELSRTDTTDGRVLGTLTLGKTYQVIGIEGDDYRILDDSGEPILFDPACFDVVDRSEPPFWVSLNADGLRYAYPPEWLRPGFFEDYHDYKEDVRSEFREQYQRYFGSGGTL
jgi:hypothetical protein